MTYLIEKYPDGYEGWAKEYAISQDADTTASMVNVPMTDKHAIAVESLAV